MEAPATPQGTTPGFAGTLSAIALARWGFVIASILATLVNGAEPQAIGLVLVVGLAVGNLAVLRGIQRASGARELKRIARASVVLDLVVSVVWVAMDTAQPGGGQMYLSLGLVGVETAALLGGNVTLAYLVAVMAILGGADAVGYAFFGRPQALPVALMRVALLWSIILAARLLIGAGAARPGDGGAIPAGATSGSLKEAAFQEVLDGAPSAIIAADDSGHVVMVNAAALRLFDRTRREMLGVPATTLVPGLYEDLAHGAGARYLTKEVSSAGHDRTWQGIRRDGGRFPAEVSYSTLQVGQRVLVAASVRDITDRVKAEFERDSYKALLDEAQRLESLGRLAGGIAHDFNNMLNVILNYTDFVEEATGGDPAVRADLGEIRAAGRRAARLTQQLLRLAGREALRPEAINLAEEVGGMEGRLKSILGASVSLQIAVAPGLPLVHGDTTMVNEVLGILVENAVQAEPRDGRVVVAAREVEVTTDIATQHPDLAPGRYVVLSVVDTGRGMDADTRSRSMEPFFTTRETVGAGLGLPTAYGLARQSGGTLVISSEPGQGTTVDVYLPVTTEQAAPVATVSSPPAAVGRRGRQASARALDMVLLLDHDQAARTRTAEILIRHDFEVAEAQTAPDALRLAVEEPDRIKLVIIDRVMGSMLDSGLPEMLRSLLPGSRMILMSTFSRTILASQGMDDPALPFLDKQHSEEELMALVREVLSG